MEFERWTERFSVGDPLMDAYHHIFLEAIREFGAALPRLTPEKVEERIAFLTEYAAMHFSSEERLMEQVAYPDLEHHRELHRAFRERVEALQTAYQSEPSQVIAQQLLALSQDWLCEHILGEDMKYKPYLDR